MRSKVLAAGVVLLVVTLGWAFRWEYSETVVRSGGRKEMVRTNRFTGDSERLTNSGWLPIGSSSTRADLDVEKIMADVRAAHEPRSMPQSEWNNWGSESAFDGSQFMVTLTNPSQWSITEIKVEMRSTGSTRILRLIPDGSAYGRPLAPGARGTFKTFGEYGLPRDSQSFLSDVIGVPPPKS